MVQDFSQSTVSISSIHFKLRGCWSKFTDSNSSLSTFSTPPKTNSWNLKMDTWKMRFRTWVHPSCLQGSCRHLHRQDAVGRTTRTTRFTWISWSGHWIDVCQFVKHKPKFGRSPKKDIYIYIYTYCNLLGRIYKSNGLLDPKCSGRFQVFWGDVF